VIRVGVLGANGRMGREVCRAVESATDLDLVAAWDRSPARDAIARSVEHADSSVAATDRIEAFADAGAHVAVDFTHPQAVMANVRWCFEHGLHVVIGTTGIRPEDLEEIAALAEAGSANAIVAPNFAIGAVLMMRFAEQAAWFLPSAEIVELHHDQKSDAPSGTAIATARRIGAARPTAPTPTGGDDAHPGARGAEVDGVHVHSVRLPGLLAHQEVILGGPGQTLTIRHDSTDRSSFMPGVLLAIRAIGSRRGLTVGIEPLLEDR
jgi:4-hydroxy-tetrahydrodipicolinate reductase